MKTKNVNHLTKENINRVNAIASAYDKIEDAESYFRATRARSLWDKIRDKQLSITCSFIESATLTGHKLKALDIGCSSGRYTKALQERGLDTLGLDTAIIPLKWAVEHVPNASFIRASAIELPFEKESFDAVVCIELFHHFTDDILEKTLDCITNIIKPDGIFVFDLKNQNNPVIRCIYNKKDTVDFTLKTRTISCITSLVEKRGFKIQKKVGILFPIAFFAPFVVLCAIKSNKETVVNGK